MKINRRIEFIIVAMLYLSSLWLWTLPFQKNRLPYGEVDAAGHFAIGDYTALSDKSINVLPYYIDKRYGRDNAYKQHTLWYPPPYHMAFAIAQIIGGERILPIFLANAIFSSLIVVSVYFIIRKLFGFTAAILSAFLLIFSMRDILVYLWGQWPERMGFAYLPLTLYCFYKYISSYLNKEQKPIYLYVASLLLAANFFIHPMTFMHTGLTIFVFSVFILIKEKKIFFNIKHVFISILLFLFVISIFPAQTMNVLMKMGRQDNPSTVGDFSRIFFWAKGLSVEGSVPDSYFSYEQMIGSNWTIPFIFLGILVILLRRDRKDLVLFAWLVSLYIMVHLDVIGKGGRVHRSLSGTAHIFYPLMILGILYILSYAKYFRQYKAYIKYGAIALFVIFIVASNGKMAYSQLKNAYSGILRITPYQYEASEWMRDNLPVNSSIYRFGTLTMPKSRWLWMLSNRHIWFTEPFAMEDLKNVTHILMDYSDRVLVNDQQTINSMQILEKENLANSTLLYDKNYIKVYKFGS